MATKIKLITNLWNSYSCTETLLIRRKREIFNVEND